MHSKVFIGPYYWKSSDLRLPRGWSSPVYADLHNSTFCSVDGDAVRGRPGLDLVYGLIEFPRAFRYDHQVVGEGVALRALVELGE